MFFWTITIVKKFKTYFICQRLRWIEKKYHKMNKLNRSPNKCLENNLYGYTVNETMVRNVTNY